MNNKKDNKIITFIKENIIYILIIIFFALLININLPYTIYSPGGTINVANRLTGSKYESNGTLNMTYVSSMSCKIPTYLLALILPEWDIIDNNDLTLSNESIKESLLRDKIYLYESISNATYLAYTYANKDINITKENNYITLISDEANTNLKIGDKIISINNKRIKNYNDISEIIESTKIGTKIDIIVIRNDKEIKCFAEIKNIDNSKKIGIGISSINEYEKNPDINYSYKSSESGPSGGLMLSLALYNSLIDYDITKGLKISGTGTINKSGEVGAISGVKYKLSGAVKKKSDVFIVAEDNYEEAIELVKKYKYDIKIIKAISFEQVLKELSDL